jgi:protein-disulfide isomerase
MTLTRSLFVSVTVAALAAAAACSRSSGDTADSSAAPAAGAATLPSASSAPSSPAAAASDAPSASADARVARADQDRIMGDPGAKLWILVVSDFQCPYCALWERETAPQLIKEYVNTGRVRLAFLNFPLEQHRAALPASEAAMCAGAQGKFWPMHDRIFETQADWSKRVVTDTFFEGEARALGLDVDAFRQCVADHVMRPMIEADVARAERAGAKSTPTFFIGGFQISGAEKIDVFRTTIAEAMKELGK